LTQGIRFSLQERDPDGNDLLIRFALAWTAPYPAAGTEVHVFVRPTLRCTGSGLAGESIGEWIVTWCEPSQPTTSRRGESSVPVATGASESEAYEFVLVDENGIEGANPTAEDAYACTASSVMDDPGEQMITPWDLAGTGLGIATDRIVLGRSRLDPKPQSEPPGVLGLYFDAAGLLPCGPALPLTGVTLYGVFHPSGVTLCGITGVEFRIANLPPGWFAGLTGPPGSLVVGQPLIDGGAVAFGHCAGSATGAIPVFTLQVIPTTLVTNHLMQIAVGNPSSNPVFSCPWAILCDVPYFSGVCIQGTGAVLNPGAGGECDGTVGVQQRTWSGVKLLYD